MAYFSCQPSPQPSPILQHHASLLDSLLHLHLLLLLLLGVVVLHVAPSEAKYCNVSTEMQITDAQFCRNSSPPIQHFQHCHQSSHFQAVLRQIFCILWLSKLFNPAHCSTFARDGKPKYHFSLSICKPISKEECACLHKCVHKTGQRRALSPQKIF